jgi:hypothetical protein
MKVVLTRKLAHVMDGIDVAGHQVGDVLDLAPADARLLLAEHWAIPERRRECGPAPARERRRSTFPLCEPGQTDLERAS